MDAASRRTGFVAHRAGVRRRDPEAVAAAVASGRSYQAFLSRAEKQAETAERERLLIQPPPLHGSASWASAADLGRFLKERDHFDNPSSIVLAAFLEDGARQPAGFVHWDGESHLLTVAPTRAGKSVTTIIPNLLHYRGSVVVLDPQGRTPDRAIDRLW
ncbi:type IV secretory system conjugative DNA transfer family protein [Bradyrhizobium sp. UFLA05-112]